MINKILSKINAEISKLWREDNGKGSNTVPIIVLGLEKAKEIILAEQKEPLTIGDKIRESNESLAEWVERYQDNTCNNGCDGICDNHANCHIALLAYLNQPQEDTNGIS